MARSRSHIVTADPRIAQQDVNQSADWTIGDGSEKAVLDRVVFVTNAGEAVSFEPGDTLLDEAEEVVGEITRILYSTTANQTGGRPTDWHHTVYIQYTEGSVGGVPLGELAQQWEDGILRKRGDGS